MPSSAANSPPMGVQYARKRIVERLGELKREKHATRRVQERRANDLRGDVDKLIDAVAPASAAPPFAAVSQTPRSSLR